MNQRRPSPGYMIHTLKQIILFTTMGNMGIILQVRKLMLNKNKYFSSKRTPVVAAPCALLSPSSPSELQRAAEALVLSLGA